MKLHRMILAALTALGLLQSGAGFASQSTNCIATTGTISGLALVQSINLAFATHISANSGASAPATDCTAAPVRGQVWLDTSAAPYAMKLYDGASWLTTGTMDATAHLWRVRPGDGTLAAPGVGFSAEPGTGLRRAGSGDLRLTVGGTDILQVTSGGLNLLTGTFNAVPIGSMFDYGGSTAPAGYLLADGTCKSRTTYSALYAVYGTTYGVCDGSTTFGLPDARGRVVAGKDDMGGSAASRLTNATMSPGATTLGGIGGAQTSTLSTSQLPAHSFTVSGTTDAQSISYTQTTVSNAGGTPVATTIAAGTAYTYPVGVGGQTFSATTNSVGSGGPVALVQPTIVLNKIIKY